MTSVIKITNQCAEPLKIFTLYHNHLFFPRNEILYLYDIYTNNIEEKHVSQSIIDDIYRIEDDLFIFQGNFCEIYNCTKKYETRKVYFNELPKVIKKYNNTLYVMTHNRLYILTKDNQEFKYLKTSLINENKKSSSSFQNKKELVTNWFVDFTIADGLFLLSSNNVVLINNIKLDLNSKTNEIGQISQIEAIKSNILILLTPMTVFVYKLYSNVPTLIYQYNSQIKYLFRNFAVSNEQIVELSENIPIRIVDEPAEMRECAINAEFIYLFSNNENLAHEIEESSVLSSQEYEKRLSFIPGTSTEVTFKKYPHLQKSAFDIRISQLFSTINFYMTKSRLTTLNIADFRSKIIDTLKSIFIELSSTNDSLKEKISVLERTAEQYEQKVNNFENKRKYLVERVEKCKENMRLVLLSKKQQILEILSSKSHLSNNNEMNDNETLKKYLIETKLQNKSIRKMCRDFL